MKFSNVAWCGLVLLLGFATHSPAAKRRSRRVLLTPANGYGAYHYPAQKWRATLGMQGDVAPAIADLDLDGTQDIIFQAVDGNRLVRLTDDGRVVWRVNLPEPEQVPDFGLAQTGVTLGDVNRDGALDILLTEGKILLCFSPEGKERWRRTFGEAIFSQPTIADLEGDGKPEILVGANDNKLHVLTSDGKDKWNFATKSWIVGGVSVGDFDGDGKLETVFGSMDYKIYCLDAKGLKKWEFATEEWVETAPVIADVDRDGKLEVLGVSDDGKFYCLSNLGTLKWQVELSSEKMPLRTYLAVGDLDHDGTLETIVPTSSGVAAINAFGDLLWQAPTSPVTGSPLVIDLNGDGWQEVVFATKDGQLMALNSSAQTRWQVSLGQVVEATPAICDADHDGKYEIYVANLMQSSRNSGFFTQYEITAPGGNGQWTSLHGDPYRTGFGTNAADFGRAQHRGGDYATDWEPFGVGARPKTGLQPPRQLRVAALPLDDAKGNRDGALDPGETATLKVRVSNVGRGPSYENLLTLDLGQSPLTINRNSLYIGWIAPGATKTATFRLTAPPLSQILDKMRQTTFRDVAAEEEYLPSSPLKIQAARSLPRTAKKLRNLKFETIDLKVLESGVLAAVSRAKVFNVPPLPPELTITQRQLLDGKSTLTAGNGNRRLDAGETAVLRLLLTNTNLTTAKRATVRLTSSTNDVLVTTPLATMENVVPYGGRWVSFGLRVARQTKLRRADLQLTTQTVTEKLGPAPPQVQTLSFPLNPTTLDTVPPEIQMISPATRIASLRGTWATVSGVIGDSSGMATFQFEHKNVPLSALKSAGAGKWRFSFVRALKLGENVFPLSATDNAGNTSTTWVRVVRKP